MEGKRPRGRVRLRWKEETIREEPLTGRKGKVSAILATLRRETAAKGQTSIETSLLIAVSDP